MIEEIGNYWNHVREEHWDALVCTTNRIVKANGSLVMGAGIAKDFVEHFPGIDAAFGKRYKAGFHIDGFMVCKHLDTKGYLVNIVAFPTKHDWKDKFSSKDLIVSSTLTLRKTADIFGWERILMTRPGCGMGGLDWNKVGPYLNKHLDERFMVVNR